MVACEYWFNNDYENRVKNAAACNKPWCLAIVDAAGVTGGVNVLNIRFKDETGQYSATLSRGNYRCGCFKHRDQYMLTVIVSRMKTGVAQGGDFA